MGYPAGELLVLGWELRFQALCHSSTVWEHLKVQKFMDQHNFEMIHFKCTIPAIGCTIPVLLCLEFNEIKFNEFIVFNEWNQIYCISTQ